MKLIITDLNLNLATDTIRHIRRQAQCVFSKTYYKVRTIKVIIDEINQPKYDKDKNCRVLILPEGMPGIVITDKVTSVMTAINMALSRAGEILYVK